MVGIAKNDLGPEILEIALRDGFHRTTRSHGHERRRLNDAMRRGQLAPSRGAIAVQDTEVKWSRHQDPRISPSTFAFALFPFPFSLSPFPFRGQDCE